MIEFANGVKLGGEQVVVMAGPCSIENEAQIFETAKRVKAAGASFLRGGAYKPRSSPYAFQGMGIPGLKLMYDAARANGLLVVSEVMEISQIEADAALRRLLPGGRAQHAELQPAARAWAWRASRFC